MFGRFSTLWMNELLFANYLFRFKSLWLSKQISYNSSNNIWTFFVMKCIIYKQPSCILNVVLWQYVKFYAILPTLFHSQSLLSQNNCLTIAYLFEQNCPKNLSTRKIFFRLFQRFVESFWHSWQHNINRKIRNILCQSTAVTLLGFVGTWLKGNSYSNKA